jgi:hypothetical protein
VAPDRKTDGNFHRLREPRLTVLRAVDFRAEVLPVLERLRALPLSAPAVWRGVFLATVPERLRPLSLRARPPELRAPLRLPAVLSLVDQSEFLAIEFLEEFFSRDFLQRA